MGFGQRRGRKAEFRAGIGHDSLMETNPIEKIVAHRIEPFSGQSRNGCRCFAIGFRSGVPGWTVESSTLAGLHIADIGSVESGKGVIGDDQHADHTELQVAQIVIRYG